MEAGDDLLVLNSKDILDTGVVNTVQCIEQLGRDPYNKYVKDRSFDRTKPVTECIKRNKLPLFNTTPVKTKSITAHTVNALKDDCHLFSRLYIACQSREGDFDNFFMHENHAYPPSLSKYGKLHQGTKSDLTDCLETLCTSIGESPLVDIIIVDGAAVINMLKPASATTFKEYATQVFIPYIKSQLSYTTRIDVVWDVYKEWSLKAATREKRGKGQRRRVAAENKIP